MQKKERSLLHKGLKRGFHLILLAFLPAVALFLAIPPIGLFPLSFVALLPVFHVIRSSTYSQKQKIGFAFLHSLAIGVAIHFWLYHAAVDYGGFPPWIGVLVVLVFGCVANLEFFISCCMASLMRSPRWSIAIYFFTFVLVMRWLPIKLFPWSIAAPQAQVHVLAPGYFFTGTLGMLIFSLFMNYAFEQAGRYWQKRDRLKLYRWCGVMSGVVIVFAGCVGVKRILDARDPESVVQAQFLLVQGNIANAVKLDAEQGMKDAIFNTLSAYQRLTQTALESDQPPRTDIPLYVIWPETAYPIAFQTERDAISHAIDDTHMQWMQLYPHAQFIFGSYHYAHYDIHGVQNVIVWTEPGQGVKRYAKQRLLAFGEFLPFRKWLPPVLELQWPYEDFHAGEQVELWKLNSFLKLLPNICYEVLFDDVSSNRFRLQANMLLNVTNDGWWSSRVGREVHLLMARERAAVSGVPLLRVTNTGISAWINSWGDVEDRLDENQPQAKLILKKIPVHPWGPVWWGVFQSGVGWLLFCLFIFYVVRSEKDDVALRNSL